MVCIGAFVIGYFGGQVLGHTRDGFIGTLGLSVAWAAFVLSVGRSFSGPNSNGQRGE